jgi:protein gp37
MKTASWHTYMVLTKRPGPWLRELPPECWVGVSIEHQDYEVRWQLILKWAWPGALRFVSVEPMLGPVTFTAWVTKMRPAWVICGPETGPGARPCEGRWIDNLAAESPCFFDKRKFWARREYPSEL